MGFLSLRRCRKSVDFERNPLLTDGDTTSLLDCDSNVEKKRCFHKTLHRVLTWTKSHKKPAPSKCAGDAAAIPAKGSNFIRKVRARLDKVLPNKRNPSQTIAEARETPDQTTRIRDQTSHIRDEISHMRQQNRRIDEETTRMRDETTLLCERTRRTGHEIRRILDEVRHIREQFEDSHRKVDELKPMIGWRASAERIPDGDSCQDSFPFL